MNRRLSLFVLLASLVQFHSSLSLAVMSDSRKEWAPRHQRTELNTREKGASDQLRALFLRHMSILRRTVLTFHYSVVTESTTFNPTSREDLRNLIEKEDYKDGSPETFFSNEGTQFPAGLGLYVAVDTSSAREYGGLNPELWIIPMMRGGRILMSSNWPDDDIVQFRSILQAANSDQCLKPIDDPRDPLKYIVALRNLNEKCSLRKILFDTFADLRVEALMYSFPGRNGLTECSNDRSFAFNIISPSIIDFDRMEFYSDNVSMAGARSNYKGFLERFEMEEFNAESLGGFEYSSLRPGSRPPKTLDVQRWLSPRTIHQFFHGTDPDKEKLPEWNSYRAWKAKNIFRCGYHDIPEADEDRTDWQRVNRMLFAPYDDEEVRQWFILVKTVVGHRIENDINWSDYFKRNSLQTPRDFGISRIKAFQRAEFNNVLLETETSKSGSQSHGQNRGRDRALAPTPALTLDPSQSQNTLTFEKYQDGVRVIDQTLGYLAWQSQGDKMDAFLQVLQDQRTFAELRPVIGQTALPMALAQLAKSQNLPASTDNRRLGALAHLVTQSQLGSVLGRIVLNRILIHQGQLPLLTSQLPLKPNKPEQEKFNFSKAAYLRLLQNCHKLYSDSARSLDEIQKTNCAIDF